MRGTRTWRGSRSAADRVGCGVEKFVSACLSAALWLAVTGSAPAGAHSREQLLEEVISHSQLIMRATQDAGYKPEMCRCPIPVTSAQVPPHVRWALVSTEDKRFYSSLHDLGFDPIGEARAAMREFTGSRQGGSGINQQLAKNLVDGSQRSISRKISEVRDAKLIEDAFRKRTDIITAYLNNMDFGHVRGREVFGIEQAARAYFGKATRSLNLFESAELIGMLKGPSKYNPLRHPHAARKRAEYVLRRMVEEDHLTAAAMRQALRIGARPGRLQPVDLEPEFYLSWVQRQVAQLLPNPAANPRIRVVIGMDPLMQVAAQERIAHALAGEAGANVHEAALVAIDQDGLVKALVGGRDFRRNQYDLASTARRQPGSAFKPFVYLSALELGRHPGDVILDAPLASGDWPRNFDHRYHGRVQLRFALEHSLNAATVQLEQQIGPANVVKTAHRLGIESPLRPDLALALGASEVTPLELTAAYVPFANGGRRVTPHGIIAILSIDGDILYDGNEAPGARVMTPQQAHVMTGMLRSVVAAGTGVRANYGPSAVGKTGTSQDFRDAWFVGFDRQTRLVTGVWVGNKNGTPMAGVSGPTLPAEIWRRFYESLPQQQRGTDYVTAHRSPHPHPIRHGGERPLSRMGTSASTGLARRS